MLLILSVIVVAVLAGFVLGGRLAAFESFRLRWWALGPVGLLMQLAPVAVEGGLADTLAVGLLLGSYLLLFAFCIVNIRAPGLVLILLGLAMNFTVIVVNAGMPVSREALIASHQPEAIDELDEDGIAKHHLAGDGDVLLFLADVIPVGKPFDQVISAGDLVVYSGVIWLVAGVMRRRGPARAPAPPPERIDRRRGKHRRARRSGSSTRTGSPR